MSGPFVRRGLAKKVARQVAIQVLAEPETLELIAEEHLTAEERLVAYAELRNIMKNISTRPEDFEGIG